MNRVSDPELSIIICTYNPEERIFSRVLKAVEALEIEKDTAIECVIVDNNSAIPITEMASVKAFLAKCNWAKVIRELKQGLSFARLAGVRATTASSVVFFDDDNEPASNYLRSAQSYINNYPWVGVWGPGKVTVDFLDPVSEWFSTNFGNKFLEKNKKYIEYGCVRATWTHFYPAGAGQVIKRAVLERYYQEVETGKLTSTDRKGNSLSSAGDVQIVWEAVKMGFAVGMSPELQLTHLIPGKRSNLDYVKRLTFGTASSYSPALVESFPEEQEKFLHFIPSNIGILSAILQIIFRDFLKLRYKFLLVDLASYMGQVIGILRATQVTKRQWVYQLVKLLKLE